MNLIMKKQTFIVSNSIKINKSSEFPLKIIGLFTYAAISECIAMF